MREAVSAVQVASMVRSAAHRVPAWIALAVVTLLTMSVNAAAQTDVVVITRRTDYSAVIRAIDERVPPLMRQNNVPGVAIAMIDGDSVVWSKGFGRSADSVAITDTTLFSTQSISKTYTAAVVMRAVELGWLSLDDPLVKHVPEFTARSRLGPDEVQRITIRHLLSHRACLPHEAPIGSNFEDSNASFEAHIRSISESWLLCPVGSRYSYSNLGIDLAGYVLERIARRPFAAIADSLLLRPLGMRRSTFDFGAVRKFGVVTNGHVGVRVLPLQGIPIIPSGGLYSTVRDMGRFVSYMITQGRSNPDQVLAAASIAELSTPQFAVPGQTAGYGLGLQHVPAFGAVRLSHSGGGLGFTAEQRWIPAYGVGAVVLANQEQNANASGIAAAVLQLMLQAKYGAVPADARPTPGKESSVTLSESRLRLLEGEYKSSGPLVTIAVRNSQLIHVTGTDTTAMLARDANEFFAGRRIYRFREDGAGKVTGVQVVDPNYSSNGNEFWPLNRSPRDPAGPNVPAWSQYLGDYELHSYGTRWAIRVYVRDGYLYTSWRGGLRLTQFAPRLFYTPEGEVAEFRSAREVIVGNRRFLRVPGGAG